MVNAFVEAISIILTYFFKIIMFKCGIPGENLNLHQSENWHKQIAPKHVHSFVPLIWSRKLFENQTKQQWQYWILRPCQHLRINCKNWVTKKKGLHKYNKNKNQTKYSSQDYRPFTFIQDKNSKTWTVQ